MLKRSLIIGVTLIGCVSGAVRTGCAQTTQTDIVTTVVHGKGFNAQFQPVTVTPAVILKSQAAVIQNLTLKATQAQKDSLKTLPVGAGAAEGDQVWANAMAIATLTQDDGSPDSVTARALNSYLLTTYGMLVKKPVTMIDVANGVTPPFATPSLKGAAPAAAPPPKATAMNKIMMDANAYAQKCQAAGVPVPPAIGDNQWVYVGDLDPSQSFLFPKSQAAATQKQSVYTYSTPNGLCVSQPTITTDTKTWVAFGIICQSVGNGADKTVSTSKACYWDNNGNIPVIPKLGTTYQLDGGYFLTPPDLPGNNMCTDCHGGENTFLNHLGTVGQKAFTDFNAKYPNNNFLTRNTWYTPIVDANWPQNPEPTPYPGGNGLLCSGCHNAKAAGGRLPNVAAGLTYNAAPATTVAGGATGGFPTRDNLYKFCSYVLPNELTTDTTKGAKAGAMSGFNALPDATRMFNACQTLKTATNPASATNWVQKHVGAP